MPSLTFPDTSDPSQLEVKQWITFHAADYSTFSSNRIPDYIISKFTRVIIFYQFIIPRLYMMVMKRFMHTKNGVPPLKIMII